MRSFMFVLLVLFLAGCGTFDVVNRPAPELGSVKSLCIIDNPGTREGFRSAMQEWLVENSISHQVLPANAPVNACDWTLQYSGKWSWDVFIFLSDAQIVANHNGTQAGVVGLKVGQWDAYKFEKGHVRVKKLMDMLFAKISYYKMPKKEDMSKSNESN